MQIDRKTKFYLSFPIMKHTISDSRRESSSDYQTATLQRARYFFFLFTLIGVLLGNAML